MAPDLQAHVFRLPGGGWGVSAGVFPGVVQRFAAEGVPAGTFGHPGRGPGELGGEVLAVPVRGEVWAVAISGGAVDVLRSSDLSLVARLQLPGEEMAREAQWQLTDLDERPAPRLTGIAVDSAGLLWASFAVADRVWAPGIDPRDDVEKYFDTRILAIDPIKRAVVGEDRLDAVCLPVERRLISCVDEVEQTIRVVALQLEPRGRAAR